MHFKSPARLLILAGVVHVVLTTTVFLIGHFRVFPDTFDPNGIGLTFSIDGKSYQAISDDLVTAWQSGGAGAWMQAKAPFHSRLHSISFATFGKLLGHNILGAEPLNLFCYLGILSCIYLLGREVFNAQAGLIAAAIVGVWPSFLLHSTQLIRDPMAILCLLSLIRLFVLLLNRRFSWRAGVGIGAGGALLVTLFWLLRGNMWIVAIVALMITIGMLFYHMIHEKQIFTGNAIAMLAITVAVLLVPARLESTSLPGVRPPVTPFTIPSASQPAPSEGIWTNTRRQLAGRRAGFRSYTSFASNIDSDVQFTSWGDIVRFVPRAFVIGFFAPFPKMWVQTGSTGLAPRLLSGLETLAMYGIYLAAGFCAWRERRNLKMWLLLLVATFGMIALGLVVVNAGALFRIRYVFWMMMIVVAAQGLKLVFSRGGATAQRDL